MNPDLELIKQYAQAIQATGMLEEGTVNGITAMVEKARQQFNAADEQGIPRETLQLLPDDQRAAMQEVLMQVQRSFGARSEGEMRRAAIQSDRNAVPTNFGAMSEGEISPDTIYENIDGLDIARRPTAPATSPRPQMRPTNLGTMGQTRPQLRP